ncbi:MAG TPA: hypothetical protein VF491_10190, partial [Vicinamibacterales bacterium]
MPVSSSVSHGLTSGGPTSLSIAHTSDSNPLYVFLSWFVPPATGIEAADIVTGITFNGASFTRGGQSAVTGNTLEWWRLQFPTPGASTVEITMSSGRRLTAAAMNLQGWPFSLADHTFDGVFSTASTSVSLNAASMAGAEVIDWLSYNNTGQSTAPTSGQTQLWDQDGLGAVVGGITDQMSSGSIKTSAGSTVAMSWSVTVTSEAVGLAVLSYVGFSDGDPGPLTIITHTDRNGVARPYAAVDLNDNDDYYDGYKEPRALSFSTCSRALSGFRGEIEHPSFGGVLSDHDRALRGLLEDETTRYLTNNPLVLRTVKDADRRAELPMHHEMVGFVSDYSPQEDYQFRFDGTDWLKKKLARKTTAPEFWQEVFSRTDFQLLPDALFNKAIPYIYGKVSDEASGGGTLYPRGTFDPGWLLLEADPVALAGPAAGSYVVYVSAITDGVESTVTRGALVFALNGSQQVDISFRTATPPTYSRVYFSDGVDDFTPFTNPTGGTFARYRDYLASDIPETGGKTLAEVVSDLNAAGATSSIHSNYAGII